MKSNKNVSLFLFLIILLSGLVGTPYLWLKFNSKTYKPNQSPTVSPTLQPDPVSKTKTLTESFQEVCKIYEGEKKYLLERFKEETILEFSPDLDTICGSNKPKEPSPDKIIELSKKLDIIRKLDYWYSSYKKAIDLYENLENIIDKSINKNQEIINNRLMPKSYKNYKQYIDLMQQKVIILQNLGSVNSLMGNYTRARTYYYNALDSNKKIEPLINQAQKLPNKNGAITEARLAEARLKGEMGNIYHAIGQYDIALEHYYNTLKILKDTTINKYISSEKEKEKEFISLKSATYRRLGDVYYSQYIFNKSRDDLLDKNKPLKSYSDNICKPEKLTELEKEKINYFTAVCYFEESYYVSTQVPEEIKDKRGELMALGQLARAFREAKKMEINHASRSNLCWEDSMECYEKRIEISKSLPDQRLIGASYGARAYLHLQKNNYTQGIKDANKYLTISDDIGDQPGEGNANNLLGVLHFKRSNSSEFQANDIDKSIEYLKNAITIKETISEQFNDVEQVFLNDTQEHRNVYLNLQQVYINESNKYIKRNEAEKALESIIEALKVAEQGRAKALAQNLSNQLNPSPIPQKLEPLNFEQIKAIAKQQQAILIVYSIIPNPLQTNKPLLYTWAIQPDLTPSIQFEQTEIPKFDFIKVPTDELYRDRGPNTRINGGPRIYISRGVASNTDKQSKPSYPDPQKSEKIFSAYYELLIKPISSKIKLESGTKLIFIPQGELFQIPFAALYNKEQKQYLVDEHPILTSPSIQVLDLIQKRSKKRKKNVNYRQNESKKIILGINNPQPGNFCNQKFDFLPLQEAELESKKIAQFFNKQPLFDLGELGKLEGQHDGYKIGLQILKDFLAKKSSVKSRISNAKIIHFATHGILYSCEENKAIPGALAFNADNNKNNGWLTANEIAYSKLQAELMVLSACDTGLGQLTADGVLGLSWASIIGGSSSTIVSLWRVNDAATKDLMIEFYNKIKEQRESINHDSYQDLDLAEALRQAMIETKKTHLNPYEWSAFTLVGQSTIDAKLFESSQ